MHSIKKKIVQGKDILGVAVKKRSPLSWVSSVKLLSHHDRKTRPSVSRLRDRRPSKIFLANLSHRLSSIILENQQEMALSV